MSFVRVACSFIMPTEQFRHPMLANFTACSSIFYICRFAAHPKCRRSEMRSTTFTCICTVRLMAKRYFLKISNSAISDMDRSDKICYNKIKCFKKQKTKKGKEIMKKVMLIVLALILALMQAAWHTRRRGNNAERI